MIRSFITLLISFASTGFANAGAEDVKAARVMWSAFKCSVYSELMNDPQEQRRLFTLGYEAGQRFIAALEAGTITPEEAQNIPVIVRLLLAGPTAEFIIGRVFEAAAGDAFDDVVTEDAAGMPLGKENWISDDSLRSSIAATRHLKANCEVM